MALPKAYNRCSRFVLRYANMVVQARYDARNPQAIKRLVANGRSSAPSARPSWRPA